jgi:hypothetical protein
MQCANVRITRYEIFLVIYEILMIAETEVTYYYVIIMMLWDLFSVVAIPITLHVFWSFIHKFLARLSDSGRPSSAVTITHWIFFSITFVLGLAEFALCVVYYVYMVNPAAGDMFTIGNSRAQLRAALEIIYWVMSMEILAWLAFVFVKSGRFLSRVSLPQTNPSSQNPTNLVSRHLSSHSLPAPSAGSPSASHGPSSKSTTPSKATVPPTTCPLPHQSSSSSSGLARSPVSSFAASNGGHSVTHLRSTLFFRARFLSTPSSILRNTPRDSTLPSNSSRTPQLRTRITRRSRLSGSLRLTEGSAGVGVC